jgi:hypothetical protein
MRGIQGIIGWILQKKNSEREGVVESILSDGAKENKH